MSDTTATGFVLPTWFDNLPAWLRHTLFSVVATLLAVGLPWAQASYTTWNLSPGLLAVIGVLLPVLIAAATPLTSQYGYVGKNNIVTGADITGIPNGTSPPADAVIVDDHTSLPAEAPVDPSAP